MPRCRVAQTVVLLAVAGAATAFEASNEVSALINATAGLKPALLNKTATVAPGAVNKTVTAKLKAAAAIDRVILKKASCPAATNDTKAQLIAAAKAKKEQLLATVLPGVADAVGGAVQAIGEAAATAEATGVVQPDAYTGRSCYVVGYYQQCAGAQNGAGGWWLNPNSTSSCPGFTWGADEYYFGLLTNAKWLATGATNPPQPWEWSPLTGTGQWARPNGADGVPRPNVGAAKAFFVMGGDDGGFGANSGNPGIPETDPPTWGRVGINAVTSAVASGGWDGIDWDDELTSVAGPGKGFNLPNAATVVNTIAPKASIWTPIAGGGTTGNWQFENAVYMVKNSKLAAVNLMAYAGGMYNPNAPHGSWVLNNMRNVPNWINQLEAAGIPRSAMRMGLSTAVYKPYSSDTQPIVSDTGVVDPDGRTAVELWLDIVTGTDNAFFTDKSYVNRPLGGVFVWNRYAADYNKQIPRAYLSLIDARLGTSLLAASMA